MDACRAPAIDSAPEPRLFARHRLARTLQPEDQISHYRIVGPLGAGGMGEVYIAQDETLGRSVALKILPPQLVRNEERLRRFVTEAKSASSLNHPNIVTIHEIGHAPIRPASRSTDDGGTAEAASAQIHYIAMELVSGETLVQKIHREKTDLRMLLGYIAQAAEGIAKAHAAGIVHRDIKPGNIMVSADGFTKVLDFGLAKLTEKQMAPSEPMTSAPTEGAATGEGAVLGTTGYMSPEQVQGRSVDHRSDIFSMGCVLYESATRRRPFIADSEIEVMHRILRDKPAPIEELNPQAPAEVRRVIRRCLAKSPDQRFQSMKDLAIELREIVEEYDTLSTSGTSTGTLTSAATAAAAGTQRRTGRAIGITASLLGLGGLALGLYVMAGRRDTASSPAPAQQMKQSVLMSGTNLGEAALSRDGRYLAYVTSHGNRFALNIRQVRTGGEAQILPPQEVLIRGVTFSPDGDYLYFLNQDNQSPNYSALYQVASLGGAPRKVAFDVDSAPTFSPDGKRICFRRGLLGPQADLLVIVNLETGEERELIRIESPEQFLVPENLNIAPAWSPDGRKIAAAIFRGAGGARSRVVTIDVESGKAESLGQGTWLLANSLAWLPDGRALLLSAAVITTPGYQVYRISYPGGDVARLTNDLDGYTGLSLSSDGTSFAAVRAGGTNDVWVAPLGSGREARAVTSDTTGSASVELIAPLGDGGVAFTAPQGNRMFVHRIGPDGSARRQLTTQGVYVLSMFYAPSAGIVFTQIEVDRIGHIWRMDVDGGGLKQLTNGTGEVIVALSSDGKRALFGKWEEGSALWLLEMAGGSLTRLAPIVTSAGMFSPDSGRILYTELEASEGRLYPVRVVTQAAGGDPIARFRLPPGAENILWGPDGQSLTYIDREQGYNLILYPIRGGEPARLTRFGTGRIVAHEWSPDGMQVAFQRQVEGEKSLWTLRRDGGEPRMVTDFKSGEIRLLRWAADSRSLVFTYGATSQDVVLISDFL